MDSPVHVFHSNYKIRRLHYGAFNEHQIGMIKNQISLIIHKLVKFFFVPLNLGNDFKDSVCIQWIVISQLKLTGWHMERSLNTGIATSADMSNRTVRPAWIMKPQRDIHCTRL